MAVDGVDDAQRANILAHLDLDEEPCDAPQWRVEQQYLASPAKIDEALEALGYYGATIRPSLMRDDACWQAAFTIDVGEPVKIRTAAVTVDGDGKDDPAFKASIEQAALTTGQVLNHGRYEALKRRWADLALERGYADAKLVANRIDVYPADHAADITLRFDTGARYRFGDIDFEQDVLADRLVRSYVHFHPGDSYDATELTQLYIALADSGYFRVIDVHATEPDRAKHEIPISVVLTGAARRQQTYGIGFSTDTGPRVRFSRTNRRFNEQGHQFSVTAQLSPVISEITANYRLPYGDPRKEWINFDAGVKHEVTDAATSSSLELGARRLVQRPHDWTRTQMLNYQVEDFDISAQRGRSRLLMPGIEWTRLRADNQIRPRNGSKLDLSARFAADALASDTNFVQLTLHGKWIWSFEHAGRVLVRGDLGTTGERELAELPPSVRFFAGGDNSVRGYDYKALGPVDTTGRVIGGESLAVASFEYEHPLVARWSIAAFVDSGNAFSGSTFEAKTGAGLGGRWQSPLGPIRVDVARALDDDRGWRLHISLGPDL